MIDYPIFETEDVVVNTKEVFSTAVMCTTSNGVWCVIQRNPSRLDTYGSQYIDVCFGPSMDNISSQKGTEADLIEIAEFLVDVAKKLKADEE
jgi:hypothetical protein